MVAISSSRQVFFFLQYAVKAPGQWSIHACTSCALHHLCHSRAASCVRQYKDMAKPVDGLTEDGAYCLYFFGPTKHCFGSVCEEVGMTC